jgi:hypothetical protein
MRTSLSLCLIFLLTGLIGCQYYEEYRNIKGDADIKEEKAELLKAHRLCLQKYEGDPAAAKERCAPYAQAVQDIDRRIPVGK